MESIGSNDAEQLQQPEQPEQLGKMLVPPGEQAAAECVLADKTSKASLAVKAAARRSSGSGRVEVSSCGTAVNAEGAGNVLATAIS